jgi:succinoglycan biosynthesis transport protein ExoP
MDATKTFDSTESRLHFLDYWRIIRVRKTVILAVFLLVAITTTLVTFILPPTFASIVRIFVQKDAGDIAGIGMIQSFNSFDPYWVQTEFEKIESKLILHQVIDNLKLSQTWGEKYREGELRKDVTYALLKRAVTVSQTRNTSLIEISVESDDHDEAAKIANEIADVYRKTRLKRWEEISKRGRESLQEKYDTNDVQIRALQKELDDLREKFGVSDIESERSFGSSALEQESLRKLDQERVRTEAAFIEAEATYRELMNYSPVEQRRSIRALFPNDGLIPQLMQELAVLETRYVSLTNSFSGEHPDVMGVRDSMMTINRQIDEHVSGLIKGFRINMEGRRAGLSNLNARMTAMQGDDQRVTKLRRPYFQLKRDLENLQLTRTKLAERIWQQIVDDSIPRIGIVEIIDPAEPNLRPVKPNKILNIGLGVIFGLAIGIGLAFFIEYLDTSVKTIDDVERALQAPVLGVIPQNVGYLFNEGPDSPHAEAYRVLRTNILFSLKDPKLNTITIVSAGAGEGKSTTIFNLATVFAQNGSRVLVVDSDLRRPSIHKILKVSNSIGLTNYLLKQNSLEDVIQTSPVATLDVMPSGKLPSSSMGVLSSAQMKELIRDLKRRYDYVFFDSPPIMGVSDASILASEVDAVLHVIQYRRYPQPMTIRAKQMIEKVGGNLLGIVLNNINMASDENYYYYSGYYYDYYSKNEESKTDEEKKNGKPRSESESEAEVEIKPKY